MRSATAKDFGVPSWASEMDQDFESLRYFPEMEFAGGGNWIFFFYDLPDGKRLGINDECIVLYSQDPDCEGIWSHYFAERLTSMEKVCLSIDIFNLIRNSSELYQ